MKKRIKWLSPSVPIQVGFLDDFQRENVVLFPKDFLEVVAKYNGGYPLPHELLLVRKQGIVFNNLISLPTEESEGRFMDTIENLKGRLPDRVIPFGRDPGGNLLCFDWRQAKSPASPVIVFWDHEHEDPEGKDLDRPLLYICETFTDLLNSLQ